MMKYSKGDVRRVVASLPRLRPSGAAPYEGKAGAIVLCHDTAEIGVVAEALSDKFRIPPLYTALDLPQDVSQLGERLGVRIIKLREIVWHLGREVIIHNESGNRRKTLRLAMAAHNHGREVFFISEPVTPDLEPRVHFLQQNIEQITRIVNGLADEESVLCFLSRVKCILTGDPGFQRISHYAQYRHPAVSAEPGDVVCEGGVAGATTTVMFSRSVREEGRVYAFEPVKSLWETAAARCAAQGNVVVENKGLWSEPAEMQIRLAGPVSTLRVTARHRDSETETCELTSVDLYFAENPRKPTLIKLDIEGAEQNALQGATAVVAEHRPKLQVCLYHSHADFLEIPTRYLDAGYRVFIGHHTPFMHECLMYATAA